MNISETGRLNLRLAEESPQRKPSEREKTNSLANDSQDLTSLGDLTARECLDGTTHLRSMDILKASLKRAQAANATDIAEALLSRGFLTETW